MDDRGSVEVVNELPISSGSTKSSLEFPTGKLPAILAIATLILIASAIYSPLIENDFISLDDTNYITTNQILQKGLSLETVLWSFQYHDGSYWHPITWISLLADFELFELAARGYHLTNFLFHLMNVLLLLALIHRATGSFWAGFVVSLLFAVHPLNVESVAWAVERKTVLSAFLFLLAAHMYWGYARRPSAWRYCIVLVVTALGLMSKPVIVPIPFVFLLLDYWPLRRLPCSSQATSSALPTEIAKVNFTRALVEKIPLLILSLASLAIIVASQKDHFDHFSNTGFGERTLHATVSYAQYLALAAWPNHLSIYYPVKPDRAWEIILSLLLLTTLFLAAIRWTRTRPWFLVGLLWYGLLLGPTIGLVRNGLWPDMADRFSYLPMIGIFLILVCFGNEILRKIPEPKLVAILTTLLVVGMLAITTYRRVTHWRSSESLYLSSIATTDANVFLEERLGYAYLDLNRYQDALTYFEKAKRHNPKTGCLEYGQALTALRQGNINATIRFLEAATAMQLSAERDRALSLLGQLYERRGRRDLACSAYSKATHVENSSPVFLNMAINGIYRLSCP